MTCDVLTTLLLAVAEIREPLLPLWALELIARSLLVAWLFYLGACVGSFLNVVVYRLPRGMNLVHPRSHCPQCGHAIRVRDNLPILSWLVLRGRCRDCHSPISPRYYYVELTVGLVFLVVAVFTAYLPLGGQMAGGSGFRRPLAPHESLPFWSTYALHVSLAATLIGATLIETDGIRVPWRLFLPAMAAGLVLPAIWPRIHHLPLAVNLPPWPDWLAGLADGVAGLVAGASLGMAIASAWWLASGRRGWLLATPVWMLAAVGAVLGWQATVELALFAMVIYAVGVALTMRGDVVFPMAAVVLALALPRLVGLHVSVLRLTDLGSGFDQLVTGAAAIGVLLASLAAGRFAGPQYFRPASPPPASPEPVPASP